MRGGDGVRVASRLLLAGGLALFVVHVWYHLTWRGMHGRSAAFLRWTDLRWDWGPFSWVTWAAMAAMGLAAWRTAPAAPPRERVGWRVTGGLFLYLALDDACMLHERIGSVVEDAWPSLGVYGWLVVVLPVLALAGLVVLGFLWRLTRDSPARRRELLAGFACMGVAIGLELLERWLKTAGTTWRGFALTEYQQPVEELFELLGPLLLLRCVTQLQAQRTDQG